MRPCHVCGQIRIGTPYRVKLYPGMIWRCGICQNLQATQQFPEDMDVLRLLHACAGIEAAWQLHLGRLQKVMVPRDDLFTRGEWFVHLFGHM